MAAPEALYESVSLGFYEFFWCPKSLELEGFLVSLLLPACLLPLLAVSFS